MSRNCIFIFILVWCLLEELTVVVCVWIFSGVIAFSIFVLQLLNSKGEFKEKIHESS